MIEKKIIIFLLFFSSVNPVARGLLSRAYAQNHVLTAYNAFIGQQGEGNKGSEGQCTRDDSHDTLPLLGLALRRVRLPAERRLALRVDAGKPATGTLRVKTIQE